MTEESVRKYISSIKMLILFLESKGLNVFDVNFHVLKDFLHYMVYNRGAKHKTVENHFSALSAFYDYLAFEGVMNSNIVLPFRRRYLNATRMTMVTHRENCLTLRKC
ncbi:phage integrase N-terminal SAM-like domain-containing protein [Candidatus Bathyarchaeota archaeon]|nr:phage integrase N-terminal SAM-like domain-containing protein [Candidatus Bathyarchaeota archaeon]